MVQAKFRPDDPAAQAAEKVVYFEDATAENGFIGQTTRKTKNELEAEMRERMGMLKGSILTITPGTYETLPPRYGVEIVFAFGQMQGRFNVAALPFQNKKATAKQKDQAMRQAYYIVVRLLEAQFQARHFLLDYAPLLPFLMDEKGRTFTEAMIESGKFPDLHRELPAKAG